MEWYKNILRCKIVAITFLLSAHRSSRGLQSPDHAAACAGSTKNRTACRLQPVQILHNHVQPPRARRHLSAAWLRAGRVPGLPAPGSPDMCGCDRAGQAGLVRPTRLYRQQTRGPVIRRPVRAAALRSSIGRPDLRASFRAAAILASSSERSGNSDRRATRCSSLVGLARPDTRSAATRVSTSRL